MRYIFFVHLFLFSLASFAQDPFKVPKEEIGKTGQYMIEQPGFPFHKDYIEIYRHDWKAKPQKSPNNKFYVTKECKPKFIISVPETYSSKSPAGIIYLGFENNPTLGKTLDTLFNDIKDILKQRNLIAITIESKHREIKIGAKSSYNIEYIALVRRSIDIIKERYEIDEDRIFTFGHDISPSTRALQAAITCPKIFKNNIFWGFPILFYHNMKNKGKTFPSFGSQYDEITTIRDASKNNFTFIYETFKKGIMKDIHKNQIETAKETFNACKFINVSFIPFPADEKKLVNVKGILPIGLDKIDPKPFNAKAFLIQAQAFEKKKNFPKAFENYKVASKYGFEEAVKKFNEMNKELQNTATAMMKNHQDKNYSEAYEGAQEILKKFGSGSSLQALNIYKSYPKDKKIVLEIKAAAFLAKAEAALKQSPPPTDKIKAACEKVIKTVPGTKTAEKAKKVLNSLK